jgi:guanine nucleotide-binding protein subunit gamma, fungi
MAVPSNANRPQNKSAMTELKYRRIADLNQKLRDDYDRPRCKTSDACNKYPPTLESTDNSNDSLIQYTKATKDYMVPSVWGAVDKKDDPYAPTAQGGCCVVM